MENWQSEYLQFLLFILATVWLLQRGSPESKEMGKAGQESDREQKVGRYAGRGSPKWARVNDWRTAIFGNSLLLVMGAIFLFSLFAQSVTGWNQYNQAQADHHSASVSWLTFVGTANFWHGRPPELAVRVLGGRLDGDLRRLPPPARIPESKPVGTGSRSSRGRSRVQSQISKRASRSKVLSAQSQERSNASVTRAQLRPSMPEVARSAEMPLPLPPLRSMPTRSNTPPLPPTGPTRDRRRPRATTTPPTRIRVPRISGRSSFRPRPRRAGSRPAERCKRLRAPRSGSRRQPTATRCCPRSPASSERPRAPVSGPRPR